MSFWATSPGPTWADCFWSYCSCAGYPIAQPIRRHRRIKPTPSEFSYAVAKTADTSQIASFLQTHFKITQDATCNLPEERIIRGIQTDWIFVIAKDKDRIIGTIASRLLGNLQFQMILDSEQKQSTYPNADFIDFFCVDPEYRKSGIGSELLKHIDYYGNRYGRMIHFFQKEISPLYNMPPLWWGTYIFREVMKNGNFNPKVKISLIHPKYQASKDLEISFSSGIPSVDTKLFVYDCGNFKVSAAITNTYHMYKNSWFGELLFYRVEPVGVLDKNIAAAIEEIIEVSGYKHILMDESIPHLKQMNWTRDSPYYIYAYNLNPRRFFTVKPEFWF